MTFQKGVSGNPQGARLPKRKLAKQVKDLLIDDVDPALRTIRRALNNKRDLRIALEAAELILAYVYGKPTQQVEIEAGEDLAAIFLNGVKFGQAIDVTTVAQETLPAPDDDTEET